MKIRSLSLRPLAAAVLGLAVVLPSMALAVGTEFTWQGELRESSLPANGSYDFEFRLFAAATGGSAIGPVRTLSAQTISGGLYTALLDFGDQFTGEPRWLEISVRRTGQPTYNVLQPRQPLTATPYAQHADFVADNSIVGANIADGSITGVDLANSSISTTQIANGTVQAIDLADGSVTTPKLANASVTAAKIAPGAIGAAQIDNLTVQQRVSARCPNELPMIGINQDGSPICGNVSTLLPANPAVTPKLALRSDGRPVIAFVDNTADDLKLANCGDPACTTATIVTLDSAVGNPNGSLDVVVRSNDLPFVAYRDGAANALHAFDCNNELCTSTSFRSLDTAFGAGHRPSIALRAGDLALISYRVDNNQIRVYDCDNAGCSAGTARILANTAVDNDSSTALVLGTGDIGVVFFEGEGTSAGLNVYNCTNGDCSSGARTDLNDDPVQELAAVATSTAPLAAYSQALNTIRLFACSGNLGICPGGSSNQVFVFADDAATDLALASDNTAYVVAQDDSQLAIRDCSNRACSAGTTLQPDPVAGRGDDASIVLRSDGRPVIAYEDNGYIRVMVCGNVGCAP